MPSPRSLSASILGLVAALLPTLVAADPSYKAVCGDIATTTCPGRAFDTSSFMGVGCSYGSLVTGFSGNVYPSESTIETCAAACANKAIMLFSSHDSSCICVDDITVAPSVDCVSASGLYAIYYHGAAAQASGLSRRQQLARTRRAAEEDTTLCPAGRTACRIEGSDDGYECIDTRTELESCGGCVHGAFTATSLSSSARRSLRRVSMAPLVLGLVPGNAAPAAIGFDCSDRSQFGPGLTCRGGACVPI